MTPTSMDEKRGPGRPSKAIKEERRKKHAKGANMTGYRLRIPAERLELGKFKYRWVNDDDRRMFDLTKSDDWTPVHQVNGEVKEDADRGSAVTLPVGKDKDGRTITAHLCRKRRDWWEEDQRQKVEEIEEQFNNMRRGRDPDGSHAAGTYALDNNSL